MSTRQTRVAVIGAGAVGLVVAEAAHDAGHDVVMCARTRPERLVIERADRVRELDVPVLVDPREARHADWVLLATKAQDVAGAAAWFDGLIGPDTTVVVLQNGVDHAERVGPLLPPGTTVLPALVYVAAELLERGHVLHRKGARLTVQGCPDTAGPESLAGFTTTAAPAATAATDSTLPGDRFAALLSGSGLAVERVADFRTAAWRKLLTNAAANPITALTMQRMVVIQQNDSVRALTRALLHEAVRVGAAAGAALTEDDVARTIAVYDEFGPDDGTSMYYDRAGGRATEHELITGSIVRLGDRHGVDVPLNRAILALMRGLNHK
ncbi:2-dehydropantoate 2-reductase [Catenuloplanes atrovinosus]|uniref:2-dehydropantoate 2-reductase n=1 Tax=Catenuloplanes atrovinosus TaxID=137266 RepID=A0AAE3YKZ8_9ACTN|nr:2-dehydropantoate 2-reductase [Catenuloplanes atrovinosus]MDR7274128.1 2-dehydropantoate 2-reductase [Catenuloplanes atrovinosus]